MNPVKSTHENEINRFWDNYINQLEHTGIKRNVSRWYVIRAEQYIKAFPDKRLAGHGPEDVVSYLEQQGRSGRIQDWQFRQLVDAIQNLFSMLGVILAVGGGLAVLDGFGCFPDRSSSHSCRQPSGQSNH